VSKIFLKYNANVGRDRFGEIEKMAKKLFLEVANVEEEKTAAGKRLKVISVSGNSKSLEAFGREMVRFPSITLKKERAA